MGKTINHVVLKFTESIKNPWGVLPYMGYIGMCTPEGYGFSAVMVIDRVSILANFGHFGHKLGMVFALWS